MEAIAAAHPDLLAQGVAMRDALVGDLAAAGRYALSCAASERAPLPPGRAGVCALPGTGLEPSAFLSRHAPRHDRVWVIAPESDGLLAALAEVVGEPRWIGCSAAAIRLAASKSATRARLAACGVPVPPAWRPGEAEPGAAARWVVKPDDGVGATDARLHGDFAAARADLERRLQAGTAATLEAWVEGEPLSLCLVCRAGEARLLSINHQRIEACVGATVAYHGVRTGAEPLDGPRGRALAALARDVARAVPGLAGYVGVDLVWSPRLGPVVIEINPRLTCAYAGLSAAIGENVADGIIRALGEEAIADVAS